MKGFTKVPNCVLLDTTIPVAVKHAYSVLLHLAWRNGWREEKDIVPLPTLTEIAPIAGLSRTAFVAHMRELRRLGLVVNVRVKNQGMLYALYESVAGSDSDLEERQARSDSDLDLGRIPTSLPFKRVNKELAPNGASHDAVPKTTLVDGRNLPMDALARECRYRVDGPQAPRLAAALNGRSGKKGIRAYFWMELCEWAETTGRVDELEAAKGERFERALVIAIEKRAALYREKMPTGSMLTPTALLTYWTDLDRMEAAGKRTRASVADRFEEVGRRSE